MFKNYWSRVPPHFHESLHGTANTASAVANRECPKTSGKNPVGAPEPFSLTYSASQFNFPLKEMFSNILLELVRNSYRETIVRRLKGLVHEFVQISVKYFVRKGPCVALVVGSEKQCIGPISPARYYQAPVAVRTYYHIFKIARRCYVFRLPGSPSVICFECYSTITDSQSKPAKSIGSPEKNTAFRIVESGSVDTIQLRENSCGRLHGAFLSWRVKSQSQGKMV